MDFIEPGDRIVVIWHLSESLAPVYVVNVTEVDSVGVHGRYRIIDEINGRLRPEFFPGVAGLFPYGGSAQFLPAHEGIR